MKNYTRYGRSSYSILLGCSVAEAVFNILYGMKAELHSQVILAWVTLAWSIITLCWVTTLLISFNRPHSTSPLCKVKVHWVSLLVSAFTWAALAIVTYVYIGATNVCSSSNRLQCGAPVAMAIFATFLCAQSITFGTTTFVRSKRMGISDNIAGLGQPKD